MFICLLLQFNGSSFYRKHATAFSVFFGLDNGRRMVVIGDDNYLDGMKFKTGAIVLIDHHCFNV